MTNNDWINDAFKSACAVAERTMIVNEFLKEHGTDLMKSFEEEFGLQRSVTLASALSAKPDATEAFARVLEFFFAAGYQLASETNKNQPK